jgi:hypothetical protein
MGGASLLGTAIHYPGTTQDVIGDPGQAAIAGRLRGYRDYHVNTRGWSDIGYNFAIDQGGRVWRCRSDNWGGSRIGAHCASDANPDANTEWMGVLLVIGDAETPNAKMIQAFRDWRVGRFLARWPRRTAIRGHRQVPGAQTSCPGNRTVALINDGVFAKAATPPPPPPEDDMPTPAELWNHKLIDPHDGVARLAGDLLRFARIDAWKGYQKVIEVEADVAALKTEIEALKAQHTSPPSP